LPQAQIADSSCRKGRQLFIRTHNETLSVAVNAHQRKKMSDIYYTLKVKVASRPERKQKKGNASW